MMLFRETFNPELFPSYPYRAPTRIEIIDVVRTVFFASLRTEENRHVPIGLMFITESGGKSWLSQERYLRIIELTSSLVDDGPKRCET